jgi:oligosaccharide repeat unit polymerase
MSKHMILDYFILPTIGALVVAISCLLWKRYTTRTSDVLNPYGIIAIFWFGMFGLGMALEPFNRVGDENYLEEPFHILTFLAVFAMGTLLLLGCRLSMTSKPHRTMPEASAIAWGRVNPSVFLLITVVLFCAGLVGQYIQYAKSGAFPLLTEDIDVARLTYKIQYYHYLGLCLILAAGLGMMGVTLDRSRFRRLLHFVIAIVSPLIHTLGASKSDAMSAFVFLTAMYVSCSRRISRVAVLLMVFLIVGVFGTMHDKLAQGKTLNPYYRHTALEAIFFNGPGSFKNLQFVLLHFDGPYAWGAHCNGWLRRYIYEVDDSPALPGLAAANAMPAPAQVFVDFGLIGSLAYCLLCGVLAGWLYVKFLHRGTLFWLLLYMWDVWIMVQFWRTERLFDIFAVALVASTAVALAANVLGRQPSSTWHTNVDGRRALPRV